MHVWENGKSRNVRDLNFHSSEYQHYIVLCDCSCSHWLMIKGIWRRIL
jgi:hypothetical protein